MSLLQIAPLLTIGASLMQAVDTSQSYRAMGRDLLADICAFDAHLGVVGIPQPAEGRTDYFLDCRRMETIRARELFLRVRSRREEIESQFPLFMSVASLMDYACHMTVNVLPATDRQPRFFASVKEGDTQVFFPWEGKKGLEWSLAVYFGLSPLPIFGYGLQYGDPGVSRTLSAFGLGVYAALFTAVVPALAAHDGFIPQEIAVTAAHRPIARAPILRQADGSYVLGRII